LMQTYVLSPQQVAKASVEAKRRGLDWFYIVDSAGGMTPAEVGEYVHAVSDASGLRVGLHAHNNSGLALANSLAAISAGATLVDATLQGMGRTTGNPPTEQLLLALQAQGHETHIDPDAVFRLGDLTRSLLGEKGNDPTHFASGAARIHSMHVPALSAIA